MGGEEPPSFRCPKCGSSNVVGYQGVWECMDCGYKFRSVESYPEERKKEFLHSTGRGKWFIALMLMFFLGLFIGYGLGILSQNTLTITTSPVKAAQATLSSSYITPEVSGRNVREITPPPGYFEAFEVEVFRITLKSIRETYGSEEDLTLYKAPYGYKYVVIEGNLTNIGSRTIYFGDIMPFVYLRTDSGKIYEGRFYTERNGEYIILHSIYFPDQEPGQEIPLIIIFREVIDTEHPKELIFQFTVREQNLEYRIYL